MAVGAPLSSLATLMPLGRTVTSVGGVLRRLCLKLATEDMDREASLLRDSAWDSLDNDILAAITLSGNKCHRNLSCVFSLNFWSKTMMLMKLHATVA